MGYGGDLGLYQTKYATNKVIQKYSAQMVKWVGMHVIFSIGNKQSTLPVIKTHKTKDFKGFL